MPHENNADKAGQTVGPEGNSNKHLEDMSEEINKEAGDGQDKETPEEYIAKLNEELDESKDKYLRAMAEMDNLRKRLARERTDLLKYGAESLLRDMLPVLDSFEKACENADAKKSGGGGQYLQGMHLVQKQLAGVLERHGLKAIQATDQEFDPNIHQAIQKIDSDEVDVEKVQQEYSRGYTYHDRLLRPAMVSVAVPQKKDKSKE